MDSGGSWVEITDFNDLSPQSMSENSESNISSYKKTSGQVVYHIPIVPIGEISFTWRYTRLTELLWRDWLSLRGKRIRIYIYNYNKGLEWNPNGSIRGENTNSYIKETRYFLLTNTNVTRRIGTKPQLFDIEVNFLQYQDAVFISFP